MITVKGKVENGRILVPEPLDERFERREVSITVDEADRESCWEDANGNRYGHWQEMIDAIHDSITEETTDLAHQHDYYLYGTPKRKD